jgi:hypothetical protein
VNFGISRYQTCLLGLLLPGHFCDAEEFLHGDGHHSIYLITVASTVEEEEWPS